MTIKPRIIRTLPGNVELREPWTSESAFFRRHPEVAGMVTEDGRVILNANSPLTEEQRAAVALNEAARVFMEREGLEPLFDLSRDQAETFSNYGSLESQRATIAARLLSKDPSALKPTEDQISFVRRLAAAMNLDWNENKAGVD